MKEQRHRSTVNSINNARQRCRNPKPQDGKGYANVEFRLTYAGVIGSIGPRPEGMSLDRIDARGHYEVGNIRWATASEQAANRIWRPLVARRGERLQRLKRADDGRHLFTMDGETLFARQWEDRTGIRAATIKGRRCMGWSDAKALTTPVRLYGESRP